MAATTIQGARSGARGGGVLTPTTEGQWDTAAASSIAPVVVRLQRKRTAVGIDTAAGSVESGGMEWWNEVSASRIC
jgi:hypothetical protein